MKYYSATTRGFYSKDVHTEAQIPVDAVELTDTAWQTLLDRQVEGYEILPGNGGYPVAVLRKPSTEEVRTKLMQRRAEELARTDGLVARHRDELELSAGTTLTIEQYRALQTYRAALRQLPEVQGFPHVSLPEAPQ